MAKKEHETPLLDQLESGRWPSFVSGLKRLAKDNDMMVDLLGQLETSYRTRKGYWKGGTVGVFGYGGGVIPRFTELKDENEKPVYPDAAEFHTLRVQPPAGMHYDTRTLRKLADIWEEHGSGLIAFHGQSGDIMFQGARTDKVQDAFNALNEVGFDLGGAGPALRTSMACAPAMRPRRSKANCSHSSTIWPGATPKPTSCCAAPARSRLPNFPQAAWRACWYRSRTRSTTTRPPTHGSWPTGAPRCSSGRRN